VPSERAASTQQHTIISVKMLPLLHCTLLLYSILHFWPALASSLRIHTSSSQLLSIFTGSASPDRISHAPDRTSLVQLHSSTGELALCCMRREASQSKMARQRKRKSPKLKKKKTKLLNSNSSSSSTSNTESADGIVARVRANACPDSTRRSNNLQLEIEHGLGLRYMTCSCDVWSRVVLCGAGSSRGE
jgi:hypothetical protein